MRAGRSRPTTIPHGLRRASTEETVARAGSVCALSPRENHVAASSNAVGGSNSAGCSLVLALRWEAPSGALAPGAGSSRVVRGSMIMEPGSSMVMTSTHLARKREPRSLPRKGRGARVAFGFLRPGIATSPEKRPHARRHRLALQAHH